MHALVSATTGTLPSQQLDAFRTLLDTAFNGEFSEHDWAHALGGLHVWIAAPGRLVSHGALIERTLVCNDQRLCVGYVEAVATLPEARGQGYGTAIMRYLGDIIREQHRLGGLSTGKPGFYERLGWERWVGPTFVDRPGGRERTSEDDGGVMILRTPRSPAIDVGGRIVCDWRPGDVW
jgi:aminoglycoside 2'-N-acetyltransferase I